MWSCALRELEHSGAPLLGAVIYSRAVSGLHATRPRDTMLALHPSPPPAILSVTLLGRVAHWPQDCDTPVTGEREGWEAPIVAFACDRSDIQAAGTFSSGTLPSLAAFCPHGGSGALLDSYSLPNLVHC